MLRNSIQETCGSTGRFRGGSAASFWSKVAVTSNPEKCWDWKACRNVQGYGRLTRQINGRAWRYAHRLAYFYYFGIDPAEMMVCHTCDNPGCCNPLHLFIGTRADNNRDRHLKGRDPWLGKVHPKRKMTDELISRTGVLIRQGLRMTKVAETLNVSLSTAYKARRRCAE